MAIDETIAPTKKESCWYLWRCTHDVTGFQILGCGSCISCRNTDHSTHYKGHGLIKMPGPFYRYKNKAGAHEGRNGHSGDRVI